MGEAVSVSMIKKRILFVDDDPMLLEFYRVIMRSESDRWEVRAIDQGQGALDLLDREAFDVIVCDLRMPGLSGFEVMRQVSQRHPQVARITISGIDDQNEVARCMEATHQFLPKPFDVKAFRAALACIGSLDTFLAEPELQGLVAKLRTLPSFPSLYLEIMAESRREASCAQSLAEIVARDPGMTAKLLQIVNSAAFALKRRIATPLEAVQYLGAATLQSLALSTHMFSSLPDDPLQGISVQSLWEHAIATATLARSILEFERQDPESCAAAYTAGLLHDIGKLILLQSMPKEYATVLQTALDGQLSVFEAEKRVFKATHAGVGAYVLGLWGLPAPIVEAVAFHHEPSRTATRSVNPLAAVHAANAFLAGASGRSETAMNSKLNSDYLASLGVAERLDEWRALGRGQLGGEASGN
jgi:putative nucleotidyltransferase with HDIG domain